MCTPKPLAEYQMCHVDFTEWWSSVLWLLVSSQTVHMQKIIFVHRMAVVFVYYMKAQGVCLRS